MKTLKRIFSILLMITIFFGYSNINNKIVFAGNSEIYVTNTGNDNDNGTKQYPVAILDKAFQLVNNNGKIIVQKLLLVKEAFLTPLNKNVTITGDNIAFRHNFVMQSDIIFKDININMTVATDTIKNNRIVANGHMLTMDTGIKMVGNGMMPADYPRLYGGYRKAPKKGGHLIIKGGIYPDIWAGGVNTLGVKYGGGYDSSWMPPVIPDANDSNKTNISIDSPAPVTGNVKIELNTNQVKINGDINVSGSGNDVTGVTTVTFEGANLILAKKLITLI